MGGAARDAADRRRSRLFSAVTPAAEAVLRQDLCGRSGRAVCAQRPAPMRACAKLALPPRVQTCSPFSPGSTPPPCSTTATNVSARPCFVVHAFGGQRRALRGCRQQSVWEGNASSERAGETARAGGRRRRDGVSGWCASGKVNATCGA